MTLSIDASACTRCGECTRECPTHAVRRERGGEYLIEQEACIRCGHCAAVCPADAVRCDDGPFTPWRDPGLAPGLVAALLQGKRSVRRYTSRPVEDSLLEELLLTGSLAATASNTQDCAATVLTGEDLDRCREGLRSLYEWFGNLLANPVVRLLLRFTEARRYADNPRALQVVTELGQSRAGGADRLFFNAPVVVVLSAPRRNKRHGAVDCALAGAHMMLHAESMGLGSCMVGFAETALNLSARLRRGIRVPDGHLVNLVFTLGHPAVRFHRLPRRKPLAARA
jgi:nitroreductase/NAD-dependent dihydropyrimidine dehydrogenase PreA subunit